MRTVELSLLLLSVGCAAAPPPEPEPAPLQRSNRPPDPATPGPASNAAASAEKFAQTCPDSDGNQPIRVLLELDREVDWKKPPEQVLATLSEEWRSATAECVGSRIETADGHSLFVSLPEPCGPQRISGTLRLWLAPHAGQGYATVQLEGKMGALDVAARARVDPGTLPKTACVTAKLESRAAPASAPARTGAGTPGERWVASMRLQRALFGLFFPPLLLSPDLAK